MDETTPPALPTQYVAGHYVNPYNPYAGEPMILPPTIYPPMGYVSMEPPLTREDIRLIFREEIARYFEKEADVLAPAPYQVAVKFGLDDEVLFGEPSPFPGDDKDEETLS